MNNIAATDKKMTPEQMALAYPLPHKYSLEEVRVEQSVVRDLLEKDDLKYAQYYLNKINPEKLAVVFDNLFPEGKVSSLGMLWVLVKNGYNIGQQYQDNYKRDDKKIYAYNKLDYRHNVNLASDIKDAALSIIPYPLYRKTNLPLQEALSGEHFDAIEALINLGAPLHKLNTHPEVGTTAFEVLVLKSSLSCVTGVEGDKKLVRYKKIFDLLKTKNQDLSAPIQHHLKPLMWFASRRQTNLGLIQYFLDNGNSVVEPVGGKNSLGLSEHESAWSIACGSNNKVFVEYILSQPYYKSVEGYKELRKALDMLGTNQEDKKNRISPEIQTILDIYDEKILLSGALPMSIVAVPPNETQSDEIGHKSKTFKL